MPSDCVLSEGLPAVCGFDDPRGLHDRASGTLTYASTEAGAFALGRACG